MIRYDVGDVVYIASSIDLITVGIVIGYDTKTVKTSLSKVGYINNKESFIDNIIRAIPLVIQKITYINNNILFDDLNKEYLRKCINLSLKNTLEFEEIITTRSSGIKDKLYNIEGYHNYFLKNKMVNKNLETYDIINLKELLHQIDVCYNRLSKFVCPNVDNLQVANTIMLGKFYLIKKPKDTFDIVLLVGVTERGLYRYVLVLKDMDIEDFNVIYLNLKAKKASRYFLSDVLKSRLGKLRSIDTNKVKLYDISLEIKGKQIETNYHYFWKDNFVDCIIENY